MTLTNVKYRMVRLMIIIIYTICTFLTKPNFIFLASKAFLVKKANIAFEKYIEIINNVITALKLKTKAKDLQSCKLETKFNIISFELTINYMQSI